MNDILIKNGRIIDPANNLDAEADLLIKDGKIHDIGLFSDSSAEVIVDCAGYYVSPGIMDVHVHLRDPGLTHKATIATDTYAAAKGGATTVVAMANVIPLPDNVETYRMISDRMKKEAKIKAIQVASLTRSIQSTGQITTELSDIDELVESGVHIFSDDGNCIMNLTVLYQILKKTLQHDMIILLHEEDENMKWNPETAFFPSSESTILARDLELIRDVGGRRIHFQHLSTKRSVQLVRQAKADGLSVTAETCPHYLLLTKQARQKYGTNAKMAPSLQTEEDIEALIEGLDDGTIDFITSDHAPHTEKDKNVELTKAPNGIIGAEVMLPLLLDEMVYKRGKSFSWLLSRITEKPAKVFGIKGGCLSKGEAADICIFSDREWQIRAENFASISRNTPYDKWHIKGCVEMTICDGSPVYSSGLLNIKGARAC